MGYASCTLFAQDDLLVTRKLIDAPRYPLTLIQPRRLIAAESQTAFIAEIENELEAFQNRLI